MPRRNVESSPVQFAHRLLLRTRLLRTLTLPGLHGMICPKEERTVLASNHACKLDRAGPINGTTLL